MEKRLFLLIVALLMIILIPLVPRMIEFSIKVLRMLKWEGLANLYGKHFKQLVTIVRIMMAPIIIYLMARLFFG